MAWITSLEKAARLARAIASDISLYNEAAIIRGITADNLFEALTDELQEGRDLYKSRVAPELEATTNYFERAVVDIVLGSHGGIASSIW